MSTRSANRERYEWVEGNGTPMELFLNAAVDSDVEIGWRLRKADADAITIIIGHLQLSLEFFDVASLELLRNVTDDAVQRLQTALQERARNKAKDGAVAQSVRAEDS